MDRFSIGAIVVAALIVLAWWGMYRSWKRRSASSAMTSASTPSLSTKDDAEVAEVTEVAEVAPAFTVLYVATTPIDDPLHRLNLPGLGFRAKATIRVGADAIYISPAGEIPTILGAASFLGTRSARVAIDRVVEKDGLTAIDWVATNSVTGERALVTSYFRIPNIRLRESLEASLEAFGAAHIATVKEVAS